MVLILVLASCEGSEGGAEDGGDEATSVPDSSNETVVCEVDEVDGDLFLYNWSDYIDPELISQFELEFEVEVLLDTYDSNEALLAKLRSGAVYDLVVPSDYMVSTMIEGGLLVEVQKDAIPNLGNLMPFFRSPIYDRGGAYAVAYQWGTTGLAVDSALVGEDFEPSWSLVFDRETVSQYQGGISFLDDPRQTLGAALKYLGYSLNSRSETELKEAADVIAGVSDFIAAFHEGDSTAMLLNREVTVFQVDSRDRLPDENVEVEEPRYTYVIPREGAAVWVDNMAVPINAEHPCTAHAFMNFLLEAENGALLSNWNQHASPNRAAEELMPPEILENEAIYPPVEIWERLEFIGDTGDFESRYDDYFAIARS